MLLRNDFQIEYFFSILLTMLSVMRESRREYHTLHLH